MWLWLSLDFPGFLIFSSKSCWFSIVINSSFSEMAIIISTFFTFIHRFWLWLSLDSPIYFLWRGIWPNIRIYIIFFVLLVIIFYINDMFWVIVFLLFSLFFALEGLLIKWISPLLRLARFLVNRLLVPDIVLLLVLPAGRVPQNYFI